MGVRRPRPTCASDRNHCGTGKAVVRRFQGSDGGVGDSRSDSPLPGSTLRGLALRGAALRGSALRAWALRGAALRGSALRGSALRGSALRGAVLRGAVWRCPALRGSAGGMALDSTGAAALAVGTLTSGTLTSGTLTSGTLTSGTLTSGTLTSGGLTSAAGAFSSCAPGSSSPARAARSRSFCCWRFEAAPAICSASSVRHRRSRKYDSTIDTSSAIIRDRKMFSLNGSNSSATSTNSPTRPSVYFTAGFIPASASRAGLAVDGPADPEEPQRGVAERRDRRRDHAADQRGERGQTQPDECSDGERHQPGGGRDQEPAAGASPGAELLDVQPEDHHGGEPAAGLTQLAEVGPGRQRVHHHDGEHADDVQHHDGLEQMPPLDYPSLRVPSRPPGRRVRALVLRQVVREPLVGTPVLGRYAIAHEDPYKVMGCGSARRCACVGGGPNSRTTSYRVLRSTGVNPASQIRCRRSSRCMVSGVPYESASCLIVYATTEPSRSSAPKFSDSCATYRPCITQKHFTCGTLSNINRDTANVFSDSAGEAMVVRACSRLRTFPSLESTKSCW